jgi:glycosyltransferase involved in cell wall biosynthesis
MMASPENTLAPISVCIVCRNEADKLEPALDSVRWADEVLVLDLSSTDGSAELAARHGARVIVREPAPIVEQVRNEVARLATHDWILALDPDERVTPGLAEELKRIARRIDIDAVVLPRTNRDFGFAPTAEVHRFEPQLRMYRRDRVRWPEVPNALPRVAESRLYRVDARDELVLVHERSRNIVEVLERSMRYAPLQARSMIDRGMTFSARAMARELGRQFIRHFLKGRALRDGVPGLFRAAVLVQFHFHVWVEFWQQSGARRTPADDRYLARYDVGIEGVRRTARLLTVPLRLVRSARGRRDG